MFSSLKENEVNRANITTRDPTFIVYADLFWNAYLIIDVPYETN